MLILNYLPSAFLFLLSDLSLNTSSSLLVNYFISPFSHLTPPNSKVQSEEKEADLPAHDAPDAK